MSDISILDATAVMQSDFLRGEKGEKGDPNTLVIGTVENGIDASATITGESPNQVLNLVLPKGDTRRKRRATEKRANKEMFL